MRDVIFVLLPEVVLLDVAGPAEAFRIAEQKVADSYRLRFIAPRRRIGTATGLSLGPLEPLPRKLPGGAMVVIAGVAGARVRFENPEVRAVVRWLSRLELNTDASDVALLTVCAGSVIAAKAGLLAGRQCTTHHSHLADLRAVEPTARVLDNRIFVEDGPIFSSAGVTAGLDLALHVIGQHLGARVAADVARELVVYLRRSGSDPALSPWVLHRNHLHPAVHRVQDAVARNPAACWSSQQLSDIACTTPRHLARLFAEHARCSPLDYVQLIRVALARELISQSGLDLERVAEKSGFASAHQLRRVWRRWESAPPSSLRGAA
jgi:transcriptional regulator GlxA family with amidase domain